MSEFVEYPYEQSIGEIIGNAYDRVRVFAGGVLARAEVFLADSEPRMADTEPVFAVQSDKQDQRGQQTQSDQDQQPKPDHVCGTSCSRCGHGGSQVKKPGLRR